VNVNKLIPAAQKLPDGSTVPLPFEPSSVYDATWGNVLLNWGMLVLFRGGGLDAKAEGYSVRGNQMGLKDLAEPPPGPQFWGSMRDRIVANQIFVTELRVSYGEKAD
jgi:hypothetical protein